MDEKDGVLAKLMPEQTLEYYVERRNGNKRNYVFDYHRSRRCDHPNLRIVARGGIAYRCLDCNYVFHFPSAYQQPLHNEVIMAAFTMFVFSKEFGMDSLGEVLRRPIGQHDDSEQKPVLPEGMSFQDVLELLEDIDVNAEDGGASQLYKALEEIWVTPRQRLLREEREARQKRQLTEGATDEQAEASMSAVQEPEGGTPPDRDTGRP